ncbi:MAG TPA: ribonuclease P protein component 4 [archaeon]|nr:ribonuclease P protein component 4 [archaeon]
MKHQKAQQIGLERIYRLFELAQEEFTTHPLRSKRYIELAIKISKRARARIPPELKTKYCKKCGAYLQNGTNANITKIGALTVVECKECGHIRKTGMKAGK